MNLATAVARSGNAKIGDCAATYAAQQSCPRSCVFFEGGGCYAENGTIYSAVTRHLNEAARGAGPLEVAAAEAAAIDALDPVPGWPMRLHTVGDCRTDEAARIVAAACGRYRERGGGPVWGYTHAWRTVERASWGSVSILASCETLEQVELARGRGYAAAIVVDEFQSDRLYEVGGRGQGRSGTTNQRAGGTADLSDSAAGGAGTISRRALAPVEGGRRPLRVLPCPQMTRGVVCSDCRLCMNADGILERGYAIGFEVHGTAFTVRQARRALAAPGDPARRLTSRQLIPAYLAEHPDASDAEIARALSMNPSSVHQMRSNLEREERAA